MILRNLGGPRRLGEFRTEREAFRRTRYGMLASGLLERSPRVSVGAQVAPKPRRPRVEARSAANASARRRVSVARVELEGMASPRCAQTHHEVLGVGEDASEETIQEPSVVGEALEPVKRGVKLASHREKPYLCLGRLYEVVGRIDAAEKRFARAVQIQPACVDALRELRLINLRRERSRAFIDRFFRRKKK